MASVRVETTRTCESEQDRVDSPDKQRRIDARWFSATIGVVMAYRDNSSPIKGQPRSLSGQPHRYSCLAVNGQQKNCSRSAASLTDLRCLAVSGQESLPSGRPLFAP